jgi:hypothetical protein
LPGRNLILGRQCKPRSRRLRYLPGNRLGGESGTPANITTFVDANVKAGTTYYYVLRSVDANGVQSPASNETKAIVPIS